VTALIAGVSYLASASLWNEWFGLLALNSDETARIQVIPLPLAVRLPIAAALVAYAGWSGRPWIVPVGVMIGLPNVWTSSTALLAAVPALLGWQDRRRTGHAMCTTSPVAD
jgi:hypothetical protein